MNTIQLIENVLGCLGGLSLATYFGWQLYFLIWIRRELNHEYFIVDRSAVALFVGILLLVAAAILLMVRQVRLTS
jgi:hypothetical protein